MGSELQIPTSGLQIRPCEILSGTSWDWVGQTLEVEVVGARLTIGRPDGAFEEYLVVASGIQIP